MRACGNFKSEWLPIVGHGSALIGALLIGFIWLSVNFFLENERNTAEQAAVKNSMNLAGAFDEHLSRSLSEIDRALKLLRNRYARAPGEFDLADWLKTVQLFDNEILQVSIIDANGVLRLSSVDPTSSSGWTSATASTSRFTSTPRATSFSSASR